MFKFTKYIIATTTIGLISFRYYQYTHLKKLNNNKPIEPIESIESNKIQDTELQKLFDKWINGWK